MLLRPALRRWLHVLACPLIACAAPAVDPAKVPEPVVAAPSPAPAPVEEQLGSEPRVVLVGTPRTYDPGYNGTWRRRLRGARPEQEDQVDVEFSGLPVEGAENTWVFHLERFDPRLSYVSELGLAALPEATVTVHQTTEGLEVTSHGLSPDLQPIVERIVSDLFVAVPTAPRGVGGTFVSNMALDVGSSTDESTSWAFTDEPKPGIQTLKGKWTRNHRPADGAPSKLPVTTVGSRKVSMTGRGVYSSSRNSSEHRKEGSYDEVVRVHTGRELR